jgi:hypothetical protein
VIQLGTTDGKSRGASGLVYNPAQTPIL